MVYLKKFVAVIKVNGNILREVNENNVILPFGSEYSILLKNLDVRRAVVDVSIDGNDVLNDSRIVINGNEEMELFGILNNKEVKNKFKFIQKTEKVQKHRGNKIDDGLIRIKFGFEKVEDYTFPVTYTSHSFFHNSDTTRYGSRETFLQLLGVTGDVIPKASTQISCNSFQPQQDEGITVAGSKVSQNFSTTPVNTIVDHEVIILKLKGVDKKQILVKTPVTVKTKIECPTCGTKSKSGTKFCAECGTNIEI